MKSRYKEGFSSAERRFLDQLHFRLFGKGITNRGCPDCYRDAYAMIRLQLKKFPMSELKKQCRYRLKAGAIVQFFGESTVYTNHNLTDEVAERFLRMNPKWSRLFSSLPEGWRERIAASTEQPAAEPAEEAEAAAESAQADAAASGEPSKTAAAQAKAKTKK